MRQFAVCCVAISPLRAEASDRAEMVSQCLFGEPLECVALENQWVKVRTFFDNYEGWMDVKHMHSLRDKAFNRWLDGLTTEHQLVRMLETPLGPMRIVRGSFVPSEIQPNFKIGDHEYTWLDEEVSGLDNAITYAKSYLNTPYLWGGKSPFGIDCSGLMQVVHRLVEVNLPRDAYQQQEVGLDVKWGEQQAGDLVFFQNDSGKVHHVGLLIEKNKLIHASGFVRIDTFIEAGILRETDNVLSHRFHSIKRL
jgi:hypothetical protein